MILIEYCYLLRLDFNVTEPAFSIWRCKQEKMGKNPIRNYVLNAVGVLAPPLPVGDGSKTLI